MSLEHEIEIGKPTLLEMVQLMEKALKRLSENRHPKVQCKLMKVVLKHMKKEVSR